jgi:tetratricopeptide (TPR) repeat protein
MKVIGREFGDRKGEGIALGNLGLAYADLGETKRAIEYYEQQLIIVRDLGDRRGEGIALWNLSLALDGLGQRARAIKYAEQSLTIFEQMEDPNGARVRTKLAEWRNQST